MTTTGTGNELQDTKRVATAAPKEPATHNIWRILQTARLLPPIVMLCGSLFVTLLIGLFFFTSDSESVAPALLLISVAATITGLLWTGFQLKQQLLNPLVKLEESVAQVCQGEHGAALPLDNTGVLSEMVRDIDSISEELTDLYEDMDNRVSRHTTRLAQKTASLKILYDVAAGINQEQNLDNLLARYLRVLKEMVNGLAATARVVQQNGMMRLVGSIGLDNDLVQEQDLLPVELCLCGSPLSPGNILCEHDNKYCSRILGRKMFGSDEIDMITVPLEYQDETLGLYNIFVAKPGVSEREDILDLLKTIGSHLGMAIAKQRSDREARMLSIVEERNALAHELHDSLAQTLASLRFQVRMMEDTLKQGEPCQLAVDDLQRIHNGVDEAHTELRELLNSFRAPVEGLGLDSALEKLVERYSNETGIATYLQQECRKISLSSGEEMQVLRIVQEALVNIRKHAKAHTVRVLLTCRSDGTYVLLIEDDGLGFDNAGRRGHPGEHIGLSIMEERAQRLGGTLRIESEIGEGTRVELTYKPVKKIRDVREKWIM